MDQADQPQQLSEPKTTGSKSWLLLTLIVLFSFLGLGVGLTAYGLYQLLGGDSRPLPTPLGARPPNPSRPHKQSPSRPTPPSTPEQRKQIAELIRQLGDGKYAVRSAAHHKLIEIGEPAREMLEGARNHEDSEVRWRVRRIITELNKRRRSR